ncbi:DUF3027 domain-containing protein [Amycolatopsis sp. PS_44_ISF1]|uniref:DUF3027 domain-containing protein n=1 Tax=Amycolatopsis sp. PS_44_ISF1 TaxID=2974917 RepID=UPI0028E231AE|nr:DUF3027 domain-containing protein [Amycolatopsis sp. PS_44_ISF1]
MTLLLTLDDGSIHRKLADAADVARAAVLADAPADQVGEHAGVEREDAVSASHLFEASVPGYLGWHWSVTVALAGPDQPVTVSELALVPGPAALVAPTWVPWEQRVRAGDLGVGDIFPADKDDARLVPAYLQSDDPAVEEVAHEAGLGRVHVLSRFGRQDAAARWHEGEFGPRSDMARSAPGTCGACGFFVPLAGSLRGSFGGCTNDISPADGHIVDVEYGCGAHSEVEVEITSSIPVAELVYDDSLLDFAPAPGVATAAAAVPVEAETVAETEEAVTAETVTAETVEPEAAAAVAVEEVAEDKAAPADEETPAPAEAPEGIEKTESAETESAAAETEPVETGSSEAKSVETGPVEIESAEAEPAEAESVETESPAAEIAQSAAVPDAVVAEPLVQPVDPVANAAEVEEAATGTAVQDAPADATSEGTDAADTGR